MESPKEANDRDNIDPGEPKWAKSMIDISNFSATIHEEPKGACQSANSDPREPKRASSQKDIKLTKPANHGVPKGASNPVSSDPIDPKGATDTRTLLGATAEAPTGAKASLPSSHAPGEPKGAKFHVNNKTAEPTRASSQTSTTPIEQEEGSLGQVPA